MLEKNVIHDLLRDIEETDLIRKKSHTSFGKLILADEKNSPVFSFGGANRFAPGTNVHQKQIPGPIYKVTDKYKFPVVSIKVN